MNQSKSSWNIMEKIFWLMIYFVLNLSVGYHQHYFICFKEETSGSTNTKARIN